MAERRDVIKTREAIDKAYYKLLFKKKEKITVQAILEEANISRGTFYKYYSDIPQLAEHVENLVISRIKDTLTSQCMENIIENPRKQIEVILGILEQNREEVKVVLSNTDGHLAIARVKQLLINVLMEQNTSDTDDEKAYLVYSCMAAVIFDVYARWLVSDSSVSWDEMLDVISAFLSGGLTKVMGEEKI